MLCPGAVRYGTRDKSVRGAAAGDVRVFQEQGSNIKVGFYAQESAVPGYICLGQQREIGPAIITQTAVEVERAGAGSQ